MIPSPDPVCRKALRVIAPFPAGIVDAHTDDACGPNAACKPSFLSIRALASPCLIQIKHDHCGVIESREGSRLVERPRHVIVEHTAVEHLCDGRPIEIRALPPDDGPAMLAAIGRTSTQSLRRRLPLAKEGLWNGRWLSSWISILKVMSLSSRKSLKTDASSSLAVDAMLLSGPARPRMPSSSSIPIRPR